MRPGSWYGGMYVATGHPHPLAAHAAGPLEALELTRRELERIRGEDPELHAAILGILVSEVHGTVDGALRALATGRLAR